MTVPTQKDLEGARDDALLQLRIGRSAHAHAVLIGLLGLALPAGLVLLLDPTLSGPTASTSIRNNFFLAFVIVGGLDLSIAGLLAKWEAYQLWPWERHFSLTVAAVGLNVALVVVYALVVTGYSSVAHWSIVPWLYPVAMLGVGAPLAALALTWHEWTSRKVLSLACALAPVAASAAFLAPASSNAALANDLVLSMFASALFVVTSASYLHLISSGTRTHEREVIHSGQTRLFHIADEVRQREETLRSREQRVFEREANVEAAEATHRRAVQAHESAKAQLAGMEQELKLRSDTLDQKQQSFATQTAETNTLARTVQDRESELGLRAQDAARERAQLAARERAIADREAEVRREGLQLTDRVRQSEERLAAARDAESRLEARRKDLDEKTAEMLRHESELRTRDALGPAGGSKPVAAAQLASLEDRESKLAQLKLTLDDQNVTLGRRARQIDGDRQSLDQRESSLVEREVALTAREEGIRQREADAKETLDASEARRLRYEEAVKRVEESATALERREADLGVKSEATGSLQKSLQLREDALAKDRAQLEADRTGLEAAQRAVKERERRLVGVADRTGAAPSVPVGASGESTPAPVLGSPTGGTLAAPVAQRFADRVSTGTPRLDDLLLGGLPPRTHLLLVGDAFVGKEIVVYAYLAEGLKRGEPVVLVTASRSPDEISKQISVVLPTFPDFEKKGLVRWIDASQSTPGAPAKGTGGRVAQVKGPDDHAGILSALVAAVKPVTDDKSVRVGVLGLSATLLHADEKAGALFIQNLVGILKPRPAFALYTVEAGAMPEAQVEQLLSRMDGAIRFRQERDKTFLAVAGVGNVATRDWVECRATNRALVIGSFALERIR